MSPSSYVVHLAFGAMFPFLAQLQRKHGMAVILITLLGMLLYGLVLLLELWLVPKDARVS